METSAKATSFPKFARLERDKGNYPVWRKHIYDVLEASGCEQAITAEFAFLSCDSSDSASSSEDSGSDGDELRRTLSSLRLGKHDPQPSPTLSQDDQHEQAKKFLRRSRKQERRKEEEKRKEERKRRSLKKRKQGWTQEQEQQSIARLTQKHLQHQQCHAIRHTSCGKNSSPQKPTQKRMCKGH